MTALPTSDFPLIRGVTCFCHDISKEGKTEQDGSVRICVMKKRMLHIYSLTDRCIEDTVRNNRSVNSPMMKYLINKIL